MRYRSVVGLSLVMAACGGGSTSNSGTEGETDSSTTGSPTSDPSDTISTTDSMTSSMTMTTTTEPSTTEPSTTEPSTTEPSTTEPSTTDPTTSGVDTTAEESDTAEPDVGVDLPPACTRRDPIGAEVNAYIWISNSTQSTVSKINVNTLVEEGRYITRPDSNGNPSRTSVNRNGDVAVANRNGGVTMIRGNTSLCLDPNNTSSGPNDVLPWPDGCVEWHTPMEYSSQRPVAWTAGTLDPVACGYVDIDLWTSGANSPLIDVLLVDGESGAVEEVIPVPDVNANFYGIYGAAVDSGDNFWGSQLGQGQLVRIDRETLEVETWAMPASGYGITMDHNDRPWTCSFTASRFDYATETWDTADVLGSGGCAPGNDNVMWLANTPVVGVDIDTMQVVAMLDVPEYVHGVSMDFNGYVWGVSLATNAYRIDPAANTYDTVTGLIGSYTYSDMTGTALAIAHGQL